MKYIEIGHNNLNRCYYNREACFGIYEKNGKLLLAINLERNLIEMVGGGKCANESNEECLVREFMEEIGAQINGCVHFADIKCYWKSDYGDMCTLAHIYIVNEIRFVDINSVDHKPRVVGLSSALEELNLPYQKAAIDLYLKIYHFDKINTNN